MQTVGSERQNLIAGLNGAAVDDVVLIDDADDAGGQHVEAIGDYAGLHRGLAAGQGAALLAAGVGQGCDEVVDDSTLHSAAYDDVLDRNRLGTHDDNIVDEVVDHVVADPAMAAVCKSQFLLGSGLFALVYQHRVRISGKASVEQGGERANPVEHARVGGFHARGHGALGGIGLVNIDARAGV